MTQGTSSSLLWSRVNQRYPTHRFAAYGGAVSGLVSGTSLPFDRLYRRRASRYKVIFARQALRGHPIAASSRLRVVNHFRGLPLVVRVAFSFPSVLFFVVARRFVPANPIEVVEVQRPLLLRCRHKFSFLGVSLFLRRITFFVHIRIYSYPGRRTRSYSRSLYSRECCFSVSRG